MKLGIRKMKAIKKLIVHSLLRNFQPRISTVWEIKKIAWVRGCEILF